MNAHEPVEPAILNMTAPLRWCGTWTRGRAGDPQRRANRIWCGHAAAGRTFASLRACFETFPDGRRGANGQYSMADFGMSAFSALFMQSPSFLAHQRRLEEGHGRSNCQSLFGMGGSPATIDPGYA